MNLTFPQDKLEAIRCALAAVTLVADELEEMAMQNTPAITDEGEKKINGFTLQRLADTLRAAEDSASGAREWLEKEVMK